MTCLSSHSQEMTVPKSEVCSRPLPFLLPTRRQSSEDNCVVIVYVSPLSEGLCLPYVLSARHPLALGKYCVTLTMGVGSE